MATGSQNAGTHLRGARLGSKAAVVEAMEALLADNDPGVYWGGLRIPTEDGPRHFCVMGATGSGKTVLLRLLMQSVLPRIGSNAAFDRAGRAQNAERIVTAKDAPIGPSRRWTAPFIAEWVVLLGIICSLGFGHIVGALPLLPSLFAVCYLIGFYVKASQARKGRSPDQRSIGGGGKVILIGSALLGLLLACFGADFEVRMTALFLTLIPAIGIISLAVRRPLTYGGAGKMVASALVLFGILSVSALPLGFVGVLPGVSAAAYLIWAFTKGAKPKKAQDMPTATLPETVPSAERVTSTNASIRRAVVYDAKQDAASLIRAMNPGAPLVILNPFDTRCSAWDMAKDITRPSTADQVATILIPENKAASQPFFANASRQLLAGVFKALTDLKPGDWTFRDVVLATKSRQQLTALLERTPYTKDLIGQYFTNEMTASSILSELATHMGPYEHIAAAWSAATSKVSLSHWVEGEYILILGNDEAHRAALDAVNRLIFQRLTELILAMPETQSDQTWIFLDEVREAGELDGLSRLLNKGRSKGVCVVLGFQDIEGMRSVYGNEIANEIIGQCNHMALLRLNSPETAKWASERIGECETIDEDESFQEGTSSSESDSTSTSNTREAGWLLAKALSNQKGESRTTGSSISHSTTRSQKKVIKAAVLASEFLSLPLTNRANGLTGFFIVPQVRGGAYRGEIPGEELFPLDRSRAVLTEPDTRFPNFLERCAADERLTPWSPTELAKLGFAVPSTTPPTTPRPEAQAPPSPPPVSSASAARTASSAPSVVTTSSPAPKETARPVVPSAAPVPPKSAPPPAAVVPQKEAPRPVADEKKPSVTPVAPHPAPTAASKRAPRNIRESQVPRASDEEIARLNAFLNRGK